MYYSYLDFTIDLHRIIEEIHAEEVSYDYVVGIVRGGSIPAACISYHLGVPLKMVSWSTYHKDQMKESAFDIAEDMEDGKKILVVDDILDSGRTLAELMADWGVDRSKFDLAVLVWNTSQDALPDFYGRKIDRATNEEWITFWWENIYGQDE